MKTENATRRQNKQLVTYSLQIYPYSWWTASASNPMLVVMKQTRKELTARELFGQNLRRARRLRDISQEELALRAELSRTYVSEVERAVRNVSIDNMAQLAAAIDLPLHTLLDPNMFVSLTHIG